MSTRACYTFRCRDARDVFHVYKHHDGYPRWALQFIQNTFTGGKAWPLPRFEADEAAAAFVVANKSGPGGVRLSHGPDTHPDIEYQYLVEVEDGAVQVEVREAGGPTLYTGTLAGALLKWEVPS